MYNKGLQRNWTTTLSCAVILLKRLEVTARICCRMPTHQKTAVTLDGTGRIAVICTTATSNPNPGVYPVGGTINVVAGKRYILSARAYKTTTHVVKLYVATSANVEIGTSTESVPTGGINSEDWISYAFTVPTGITSIKVGMLWTSPTGTLNDAFYISNIELRAETPSASAAYRTIMVDPDQKRIASFQDNDGRTIATALVTNTASPYTYDNWSYTYYNDIGDIVASIAPEGVNTAVTTYPNFVTTYKYDHFGQTIEVASIDEGIVRYVYSLDGKLRFSQSQSQFNATPKRFSYSNYDYMGRLIESGEYTMSGTGFYVFETVSANAPVANSVLTIVNNVGYAGITKKSDPNNRCTDYTYVEYDIQTDFVSDTDHAAQMNLPGEIARTQNEHATTWYSYNEFGELLWTKQSIAGLSGYKTVDYSYDNVGNIIQVTLQKGNTAEDFYHHYTYDDDNRLTQVHTSLDNGVTKVQHAVYDYYLHGPLKRVELASAGCKQGIDYTYTINGALKGINSDDPAADPGGDVSPADFFGESLHYFDNDYDPASGSPINISIGESGFNNLYGGAVKAFSYHNSTETTSSGVNARKVYAYQYDALNQMKIAKFGSVSGTSATLAEAYRENVDLYDKNGNIKTLLRNGKTNTVNPAYNYNYITNTNKVSTITQGAITAVTYTYNDIGQVIREDEGGTKVMNMTYNALGLIKEIRDASNQLMQTYGYDDRGDLIKKTTYNAGTLVKTTYYVNDATGNALAIYEQPNAGALALKELPIYGMNRLATYKPAVSTYFYEVSDHLGNVRGVCGLPSFTSYFTNFETATNSDFLNYSSQTFDLLDHTDAGGTVYQKIQMLNGGANGRVGVAKTLAVSPGDQVSISAYVKYMNLSTTPNPTVFATALASAFGVSSSSTGEQLAAYNSLNQYAGTVPGGDHPLDVETAPKVFVTILLFDKNNALIDATWDQVTTVGEQTSPTTKQPPHDLLSTSYTVRQPGYAYIFVSNEHPTYLEAAFDDVTITHSQSPIVGGADYYPFGLVMEGREITDEPYRYGYQGQFSEKDVVTGLNEFEVRLYEPKYGRWLQVDPYEQYVSPYLAMANQPNLMIDPDGGWNSLASFGVGFVVGSVASAWIARENGATMNEAFLWGVGGGIVGGLIGVVLNNTGSFAALADDFIPPALNTASRVVTIHITNGSQKNWGGKLGGHVALIVDGENEGFTNGTTEGGEKKNILGVDKDTWNGPGKYGRSAGLSRGDARWDVKVTDKQLAAMKEEIKKIKLDPPRYKTLGKRCTSVAARVLRAGKIIKWGSRFWQESPFQFRRYLSRKLRKHRKY
jgi:RHS repeat-associated protein